MNAIGKSLSRIDLWAPALQGTGGIQQYSRNLMETCRELLPLATVRGLVRNDPPVTGTSPVFTAGRWPKTVRSFAYIVLVMIQTLRHPPDLVIVTHLHFVPLARVLKFFFGLRYWVALHGVEVFGKTGLLYSSALAEAERLLPVSRWTRSHLTTRFPGNEERISILPNRIDEHRFQPAAKPRHLLRRYGLNDQTKIILTVARLDASERYKGYDRLIQVLSQVVGRFPNLHYILAGTGDDVPRVRDLIQACGMERHVTLTGFLPERNLNDHYNLCDLFAMPSENEGFGIVYLEALACGCPVLAGKNDGSSDALLDGRLGKLIDPQDLNQMADTIIGMLSNHSSKFDGNRVDNLRRVTIENFGVEASRHRLAKLLAL